jgi:hypothetical protein
MKTIELVVYTKQEYPTLRHDANMQQASIVESADTYEAAIKKCHKVAFEKYGVTSDDIYKIRKC